MANVDGDITLSVDLEPGDVLESAQEIRQDIDNIFKQASGQEVSTSFKSMQASAAKLYDQMLDVSNAMRDITSNGIALPSDATEYFKLSEQLNNLTNRAAVARDRLQEMADVELTGTTPPLERIKNVLFEIGRMAGTAASKMAQVVGSTVVNGLKRLASNMAQLHKHTGRQNSLLDIGFKKFVQYGLGIRTVFLLVKKLRQAVIDGLGNIAVYSGEFNGIVSAFVSSLETLKHAFAAAFAPIATVALPLLTSLMNALVTIMNIIGQFFAAITGKGVFIQAKKVQKDYAASLNKTGKSAGGAGKGISDMADEAEEAQKTLAGFDDVEILKEDKSKDSGSGGGGGGGGGAGIGDMSDMFETVAIDSPIKNLADRIRALIANQDWNGLGQFLGESINTVFTKARDIISWNNLKDRITFIITAITKTFNSMVDTIDWKLIGDTFAQGFNTLIYSIDLFIEGIDWGKLSYSLFTGLNSFITNLDFVALGELLGDGINAVLDFIYTALITFDWKNLATQLMNALNRAIERVNWNKVGKIVSKFFTGILDFLIKAVEEFDWTKLGDAIFEFLSGIDYIGIFTRTAELIFAAFGSVFAGLFVSIQNWLLNLDITKLFEPYGGFTVEGFKTGIIAAIAGIGNWVQTTMVDPFINAFKRAFKISSPSKVMQELGGYIIDGLKKGIEDKWKAIKTFFSNGVTEIQGFFQKAPWSGVGETAIGMLYSGVKRIWPDIPDFLGIESKEAANEITEPDWKGKGSTSINNVYSGITSVWSQIPTFITSNISKVGGIFTNYDWKSAGSAISSGVKGGISSAWHLITGYVSDNINSIKNKFTNPDWSSVGYDICRGVRDGINDGWDLVTRAASNVANGALSVAQRVLDINSPSKVFRDVIGKSIPEGIAVGIESGSSMAFSAVEELAEGLADTDLPELQVPPIALGEIIPYEVNKSLDVLLSSIKNLTDMLQYNQSNVITKDELSTILSSILPPMLQQYMSFYIGDEEIARHANAGNDLLNRRFNPVGDYSE